jgi:tetratricopeptide (TPR) repeat protein
MERHTGRTAAGLLLVALTGMGQQIPQKQVKNQEEFNLYDTARKEQDPAKKLRAVEEWKFRFPRTELSEDRNLFYLAAYLGLEAGALRPDATSGAEAAGEQAARTVLENLNTMFAPSIKPSYIKEPDWVAAREEADSRSHWTLAAVALHRKKYPEAEAELVKYLAIAPKDPNAALMLSRAIIAQGQQSRYPEAIFQVARAASEEPEAQRQSRNEYLRKMYEGYHGNSEGLDQVKETAAKSPLPPPGWTVKSVTEISQEQIQAEERFNQEHPEIALWRTLRGKLTTADGQVYFESQLKNIELPPLKGKVLGQTSPKELTVLMDYVVPALPPAAADATIKLDAPWKSKIEPGTMISITGAVVESYTKDPYVLTITASRKDVQVIDQQR